MSGRIQKDGNGGGDVCEVRIWGSERRGLGF